MNQPGDRELWVDLWFGWWFRWWWFDPWLKPRPVETALKLAISRDSSGGFQIFLHEVKARDLSFHLV